VPRARLLVVFASSIVACLDSPTFVLDEATTSVSSTTPEDDAMVLVPATVLPPQGALLPKDDDDGEKKGKGGGSAPETGSPPEPTEPTISVPAFFIDTYEVSARAYAACVGDAKCSAAGADRDCTVAVGLGDHPVNCVSLDQARAFCAWRGKRLVRNDEWTAAAAGAELRPYAWGSAAPAPTLLNMAGEADGWKRTAPRGSFPAGHSPDGVADLAGNVAEWVDVAGGNVTRGGSHADADVAAVSSLALRTVAGPDAAVGFRCAKDP
jgi:eukaryotic-like serine/threonine-protein kinase